MSLIGKVMNTFSSMFSFESNSTRSETYHSSSTTQTIYEPDKIRVAELENQRADKLVEAQKEIIELNARMQAAVIEANARGFEYSANVLKALMIDMNSIAQQRLQLLENGHFAIVEQIEQLYLKLEREIGDDNHAFAVEKLPQMLAVLSQFPETSTAHTMYAKSIDQQIQLNFSFVADKVNGLMQRQHALITASTEAKKLVLEQSGQLVAERMLFLEQQLAHNATLAITAPETKKLLTSEPTQ